MRVETWTNKGLCGEGKEGRKLNTNSGGDVAPSRKSGKKKDKGKEGGSQV